ncbi:hypothetical protein HYE82_32230 [Streptomyces sp. BR123]|uniref:hypothetical protein n=1 Tax=Streptomyces sp. BR123 TaxID=2749828 RepID=UPI0015C4BF12|nr:hypothetical protein [Streptomyces sp. BR123]NXY98969.1 hypothetical protein [Streptomyces sp. BR123]
MKELAPLAVPIIAALIGAAVALCVPKIQKRINTQHQLAIELRKAEKKVEDEEREKRRKSDDLLFSRMVSIREATHSQLAEVQRLYDYSHNVASLIPGARPDPGQAFAALRYWHGSKYKEMARHVGGRYPKVEDAFSDFTQCLNSVIDQLGRAKRRDFASAAEAGYESVLAARNSLLVELESASNDLGFSHVIDQD